MSLPTHLSKTPENAAIAVVKGAAASSTQSAAAVEVVILDDDDLDLEVLRRCLSSIEEMPLSIRGFLDAESARDSMLERPCDLLFVDYHLGSSTALDALAIFGAAGIEPVAVLVTDGQGEDVVRDAVRGGFAEYIPKRSVIPAVIGPVIRSSLEKARLKEEIAEHQRELSATVRNLEGSRQEVSHFYHSVSHELKTPLTGAREFVSLVRDQVVGPITGDQEELLDAAIRNCDRMVTCINDMLDASRIETGKLLLNLVQCSLGTVISDAVESLRGTAEEKQIDVQLALSDDPTLDEFVIDPDRIFQVVGNLMSNAIKFTPRGGKVIVSTRSMGPGGAVISVKDSGCGLSTEDQDHIFDRLFQSRDEDAALLGGLGMGLYICREIVRLHKGEITVASAPDAGAEFTFHLPRVDPPQAAPSHDPMLK